VVTKKLSNLNKLYVTFLSSRWLTSGTGLASSLLPPLSAVALFTPDLDRERECLDFLADPTEWWESPFRFSPRDPDRFFSPDLDRERLLSFFFCSGDRERLLRFLVSLFFLSCFNDADRLRPPREADRREPDRFRDAFLLGLGEDRFFLADRERDRFLRWRDRDPDRLRRGDRDRLFRRRDRDRDLVLLRRCLDPDRPRFLDRDRDPARRPFDRDLDSRRFRDLDRDFLRFFDLDRDAFLCNLSDFRLSLDPDLEPALRTVRVPRSRLRLRDNAAFFPFTLAAGDDFLSPFTAVSESLCFLPLAAAGERERDRDISFSNL
jgi:hypothetical protein